MGSAGSFEGCLSADLKEKNSPPHLHLTNSEISLLLPLLPVFQVENSGARDEEEHRAR